tara:strand:+ start:5408 stop:6079 length:672 start_codon:yes stop_codon:yes gene_type:complete
MDESKFERHIKQFKVPKNVILVAMEKATKAQENDQIFFSSPSFGSKEFRERINKLLTALKRFENGTPTQRSFITIKEILAFLPAKEWQWLETLALGSTEYRDELNKTSDYIDLIPELLKRLITTQDRGLAKELYLIFQECLDNNTQSGGKGSSKLSRKYIDGILSLINSLEELLPTSFGISAQDGTQFNELVSLWLEHYMEHEVISPREYILEALERKKKYSL